MRTGRCTGMIAMMVVVVGDRSCWWGENRRTGPGNGQPRVRSLMFLGRAAESFYSGLWYTTETRSSCRQLSECSQPEDFEF